MGGGLVVLQRVVLTLDAALAEHLRQQFAGQPHPRAQLINHFRLLFSFRKQGVVLLKRVSVLLAAPIALMLQSRHLVGQRLDLAEQILILCDLLLQLCVFFIFRIFQIEQFRLRIFQFAHKVAFLLARRFDLCQFVLQVPLNFVLAELLLGELTARLL